MDNVDQLTEQDRLDLAEICCHPESELSKTCETLRGKAMRLIIGTGYDLASVLQPRDVSWTRKVSRFLIGLCLVFVESVLLVNGEIVCFCTRVVRQCVL